ncbi:hypothetical protein F4820DRAFT_442446 [Hypoxylon rubiginosum]|uniref:Uncharacterized protein n=1 Tax=Hypoxylon rubiginosum TaxID=110542 RepID=A0ACB9ZHL9_9PEZI|nr:hypothetical protein F4820DRAFT_442446 [Hypoxylon rubiginosum]
MNDQANAFSFTPSPSPSQTPPAVEGKNKRAISLVDSPVSEPNVKKRRCPGKLIRIIINKSTKPEPQKKPAQPKLLITYRDGPFGRLHSIYDRENNVRIFHHELDADKHISMTFIHEKIAMLKDEATGVILYRNKILD